MVFYQNSLGQTIWGHVISFFSVPFVLNLWTFGLLVIYIGLFIFGYRLISNSVKLVKKEIWGWLDRLKCLIFAFFFASGVIIIVSMMVTFTINIFSGANSSAMSSTAFFIIIPSVLCLIYITIYPLIDFLYMAGSKENIAQSKVQELIEPFIKRFQPIGAYFVAVALYLGLFIIPPIAIMLIFKIDFIYVWWSWQLIFPMFTLSYYGARGYITGVVHQYNSIPSIGRSASLLFEPGTRIREEFAREPTPRILTWVMIFFYGWTCFSMITTIGALNPYYNPPSTMTGITVYIVLFFGITGYFSRYWSRKVKFKTIDLLFAAFCIAAVGVNVLMNFTLVNYTLLDAVYNQWTLTSPIYIPEAGLIGLNFKKLALACDIEETTLFLFQSIYLWKRPKTFLNDTVYAEMTRAGDSFNPIPLFNESRSNEDFQREHCYDLLRKLYERAPLKQGFNIADPFFKDPLYDGLTDTLLHTHRISYEIVDRLVKDHPKKILPAIIDALKSPNTDKLLPILSILEKSGKEILALLPSELLLDLLYHYDISIKRKVLSIFKNLYATGQVPTEKELKLFIMLIEDSDFEIQALAIELIGLHPILVSPSIIIERLNHPHTRVKSAATLAMARLDFSQIGENAIRILIPMLDNHNPEIRYSAIQTIGKFGQFTKNKIPFQPLFNSIFDENPKIREVAVNTVIKYIEEQPSYLDINQILSLLPKQNNSVQQSLLKLLGKTSGSNLKIISALVPYLKSPDSVLQSTVAEILQEIGQKSPDLIISLLIKVPETESVIRMGMITTILSRIGEKYPDKVLPYMITHLNDADENIQINSSMILSALSEKFPNKIQLQTILPVWSGNTAPKVKKQLTKAIANIALWQPAVIQPLLPQLSKGLYDQNNTFRVTVSKLFVDLGEKAPELISLDILKIMVNDKDFYVRENGMRLLGAIGHLHPKDAITFLIQGLKDSEWNVKTAAAEVITKLGQNVQNDEIMLQIKQMLKDPEKWTRAKGLEIISKSVDRNPKLISLDEIIAMLSISQDEETVMINLAKLLGITAAQDFKKALPHILKLLSHPKRNIRDGMIAGMSQLSLKLPLNVFIPQLLIYFSDDTELTLQQNIALVIKRILKYESGDLKNRAISMLKIRVEVTQDPVLSEVLSELLSSTKK